MPLLKPVQPDAQINNIHVGVIESIMPGGNIGVRIGSGGTTRKVRCASGIDVATLRKGDIATVASYDNDYYLIGHNGVAGNQVAGSMGAVSVGSGAINGININRHINIKAEPGSGIGVRTNGQTGDIFVGFGGDMNLRGTHLYEIGSITFDGGGGFSADGNIFHLHGTMSPAQTSKNRMWSLSETGEWRLLRRNGYQAGPDISADHLIWYSNTGAPWVRMVDDGVFLGKPGSGEELYITEEEGLRINGSVVIALPPDNIDDFSGWFPGHIRDNPIVWPELPASTSPWESGFATADSPTAMLFQTGLEIWAQRGYMGYADDTVVFHVGPDGFWYGGEKGYVYMSPDGNVAIPANLLVAGSLTVGETLWVGQGEWGGEWSGIAIDSDWGFVGLKADDTWDSAPRVGSYQIWWNPDDGRLYTAQGDMWFGDAGMQIKLDIYNQARRYIQWYSPTYDRNFVQMGAASEFGGFVLRVGDANSDIENPYVNYDSLGIEPNGAWYFNAADNSDFRFTLRSGEFGIYSDQGIRLFGVAAGGGGPLGTGFASPFTISGTLSFTHWNEQGLLGVNTFEPEAMVHVIGNYGLPHVRIASSGSSYADITHKLNSLYFTGTGNFVFQPDGGAITSDLQYSVTLGTPFNRWRAVYAGELNVETLVAENKIATIGGSVMVAPTSKYVYDVPATGSYVYVEHNEAEVGDILLSQDRSGASYVLEAMLVTAGPVDAGGYYRYTVTRDIDGTGANAWNAGAAVVNTGQIGDGWIDMYSNHSVGRPNTYGPTITIYNRFDDAHWYDYAERAGFGNLNGLYDYVTTTWGMAAGDPGAAWISVDATNGIRIMHDSTVLAQWDTVGNITLEGAGYFDGTLDDIPNGAAYGKIGLDYINAGRYDLDEVFFDGSSLYALVYRTNIQAGAIKLDSVYVNPTGTYGLINRTNIQAGTIKLDNVYVDAVAGTYSLLARTSISAGKVILTSGTGVTGSLPYASVTGGPPSNATNGATWGTNLSGIPNRLADSVTAASASGLYLTTTAMGYWNTTIDQWTVYIDSSGDFYLGSGTGSGDYIALSTNNIDNYRIWVGHSSPASAAFYVKKDGQVKTGNLLATGGTIGGFTISGTALTSGTFKLDSANSRISWGSNHLYFYGGGIYTNLEFAIGGGLSVVGSLGVDGTAGFGVANVTGLFTASAGAKIAGSGSSLGFFGSAGTTKATVVGSRGGNAALYNLILTLQSHGLITDGTTA